MSRLIVWVGLIGIILASAGCYYLPPYKVKVIDAETGKPLAGVTAVCQWQRRRDYLFKDDWRPATLLRPSKTNGVIKVPSRLTGLVNWNSTLKLSFPGYSNIYAFRSYSYPDSFIMTDKFVPRGAEMDGLFVGRSDGQFSVPGTNAAAISNGFRIVPMFKKKNG